MSNFKRISASLLGISMVATVSASANAVIIGFENIVDSDFTYAEDGFEIVNSVGGNRVTLNNFSGASGESEITPENLFGSGENLILTKTGGGPFDLLSFAVEIFIDIPSQFFGPSDFTITGTKSGGSIVAETFNDIILDVVLSGAALDPFTDLTALSFGATSTGIFAFVALDDIEVTETVSDDSGSGDPVPEPGTLALLGAGILGIVAIRRRRRAV